MKVLQIFLLVLTLILGAFFLKAALEYHTRPSLEVISE